jgi:3-deoxy-manno-octulosonate cytidylyltransferase (CMP-KDO synthetase)
MADGSIGFKVVIPARYGSTRLPGKPLLPIAGKPMIQHVVERALASAAEEVLVATDDRRIADACLAFGADVVMTKTEHRSGSDRITEVIERRGWGDDVVVVNLQGDEPAMPSVLLDQVAGDLAGIARVGHVHPGQSDPRSRDTLRSSCRQGRDRRAGVCALFLARPDALAPR